MGRRLQSRLLGLRDRLVRRSFLLTRGRVPSHWGGSPVLALTTRGRRTGLPRTTLLVTPASWATELVLVASNGGADRDPHWLLNLAADPQVDVLMGGHRRRMSARIAERHERTAIWRLVESRSPAYGRYRRATTREIPLVLLRER